MAIGFKQVYSTFAMSLVVLASNGAAAASSGAATASQTADQNLVFTCKTPANQYGAYTQVIFYKRQNIARVTHQMGFYNDPYFLRPYNYQAISSDDEGTVYARGEGRSTVGIRGIDWLFADFRKVSKSGDKVPIQWSNRLRAEATCEVATASPDLEIPYDYHHLTPINRGLTEKYINAIYESCFNQEMQRAAALATDLRDGVTSSIDAKDPSFHCNLITQYPNDDFSQPAFSRYGIGCTSDFKDIPLKPGVTLIQLSMLGGDSGITPTFAEILHPDYRPRQNGRDEMANAWISGAFLLPKVQIGRPDEYISMSGYGFEIHHRPFKLIDAKQALSADGPHRSLSLRDPSLPAAKTRTVDLSNSNMMSCLDRRLNRAPVQTRR